MAKYKHVNYEQGQMIPIDFTKQIIPGTFEFTLNYLIDNQVNTSIQFSMKNTIMMKLVHLLIIQV